MELSRTESVANGRKNLEDIRVNSIECDGYQLTISTSADVRLPFILPFIKLDYVEISTTVASIAQRKITTNYYGIDIG